MFFGLLIKLHMRLNTSRLKQCFFLHLRLLEEVRFMLCRLRKAVLGMTATRIPLPSSHNLGFFPESLPEPIVIPGLSQFCGSDTDDRLLCPVRAVRAYLSRVKSKRSGRKRLFLPLKGSKDISPSTISHWICDVIKLAYVDLSPSDLSFMKISAHEVRALSSSWAYWNSVALEDVVRAAYWRTNSTFSSFCLRDLAPVRQDTSSLGPLVAAQSITGSHRSVS